MPFTDKATALRWQRQYNKRHYEKHKEQYKKTQKDRRDRVKEWLRKYKQSLLCANCPEDFAPCLDFHHVNPDLKDIGVSEMVVNGFGKSRILAEIEKCIVLCKNCHVKYHHESRAREAEQPVLTR